MQVEDIESRLASPRPAVEKAQAGKGAPSLWKAAALGLLGLAGVAGTMLRKPHSGAASLAQSLTPRRRLLGLGQEACANDETYLSAQLEVSGCVPLKAGQHTAMGQLCAETIDADTVRVTYHMDADWRAQEVHLWYGEQPSGYPDTNKGSPKIGNFEYKSEGEFSETSFDLDVSQLSSFGAGVGCKLCYDDPLTARPILWTLAHAAVTRYDAQGNEVQSETAWADGTKLPVKGGWATIANFTAAVSCETRSPTKSPTFSPTESPTLSPTPKPTLSPTFSPTPKPTLSPTSSPTASTSSPTASTASPTPEQQNEPIISGPAFEFFNDLGMLNILGGVEPGQLDALNDALLDCGGLHPEPTPDIVFPTQPGSTTQNPSTTSTQTTTCGYDSTCFLNYGFKRWGWSNGPYSASQSFSASFRVAAGAGRCRIKSELIAGDATLIYDHTTRTYSVSVTARTGFTFKEAHVYADTNRVPYLGNGTETVAPGQYDVVDEFAAKTTYTMSRTLDSGVSAFHFILHLVACGSQGCETAFVTC